MHVKKISFTVMGRELQERHTIVQLMDAYAPLLTRKQRRLLELYYFQDLSLGEIAENYGITRQAVYDSVRRSIQGLLRLEKALGLVSRNQRMDRLTDRLRRMEQMLARFIEDLPGTSGRGRSSAASNQERSEEVLGMLRTLAKEIRTVREALQR